MKFSTITGLAAEAFKKVDTMSALQRAAAIAALAATRRGHPALGLGFAIGAQVLNTRPSSSQSENQSSMLDSMNTDAAHANPSAGFRRTPTHADGIERLLADKRTGYPLGIPVTPTNLPPGERRDTEGGRVPIVYQPKSCFPNR